MFRRFISLIMSFILFAASFIYPCPVSANLALPTPGSMVIPTSAFEPLMVKGLKVHPDNPLLFDFIVDAGQSGFKADGATFKAESEKLIKYFLAALTVPEKDLWVNLSPYEKDRVITAELGGTALGRDMLAQDYILKQLTASMIYPENDLGKAFWQKIYKKAREQFGTSDIPVDTFNKVWVTADKAKVFERNNAAYVVGAHLKVMLESDMAAQNPASAADINAAEDTHAQALAKQVIREVVIPAIEQEVNEGRHFAPLRQMFHAMVLAAWYKTSLKDALLNQVYSNQLKTDGVLSGDPKAKEKIYAQYLEAYTKGVFDYIKEDADALQSSPVPRRYFSGGVDASMLSRGIEIVRQIKDFIVDWKAGKIMLVRMTPDLMKETSGAGMQALLEEYIRDVSEFAWMPIRVCNRLSLGIIQNILEPEQFIVLKPEDFITEDAALRLIDKMAELVRRKSEASDVDAPKMTIPILLASETMDLGVLKEVTTFRNRFAELLGLGHFPEDVTSFAGLARDQAKRVKDALANDPLTQMTRKKTAIDDWIKLVLGLSRRAQSGTGLAFMMLDIDFFGPFNNMFGHVMGDMALKAVAEILKRGIRPQDFVMRYGGEEFAMGFALDNIQDIQAIVSRKVDAIRSLVAQAGVQQAKQIPLSEMAAMYEFLQQLQDPAWVLQQVEYSENKKINAGERPDPRNLEALLLQIVVQNPGLQLTVAGLKEKHQNMQNVLAVLRSQDCPYVFQGWMITPSIGVTTSIVQLSRNVDLDRVNVVGMRLAVINKADRILREDAKMTRNVFVVDKGDLPIVMKNAAMAPGGIDLDAGKMDLDIDKGGADMSMRAASGILEQFHSDDFTGLAPRILDIMPLQNPMEIFQP